MKVLVAGDFAWEHSEPSWCRALTVAGARVTEFHAAHYFGPSTALRRAQAKYVMGPGVWVANAALVAKCARSRPDMLFAWRTAWLKPSAVRALQRLGTRVALYNNDDPFGPDRDMPVWRHFRRLVPSADVCVAYRRVNVDDYQRAGARRVLLLRSWFNPDLHFPSEPSPDEREQFGSDVVFVGHPEDDGRLEAIEALGRSGLSTRLFGGGWDRFGRDPRVRRFMPVTKAIGRDYRTAISASKMALVFLSKRNRDQYTRRCFEIPAMGRLMLAPRTAELCEMFKEEEEAAFYSNTEELVRQALRFAADDDLRARVAMAGRARCLRDGHDAPSRARHFLAEIAGLQ